MTHRRAAHRGALGTLVLVAMLGPGFSFVARAQESAAAATPAESVPDAVAAPAPTAALDPEAAPAAFDPEAATAAYLAQLSPEARAKSDAYFEGGYWLILWDFLAGAV